MDRNGPEGREEDDHYGGVIEPPCEGRGQLKEKPLDSQSYEVIGDRFPPLF